MRGVRQDVGYRGLQVSDPAVKQQIKYDNHCQMCEVVWGWFY